MARAAQQRDAAEQNSLTLIHRGEEGAPWDDAETVRWYRAAVEQGHAGAQNDLAVVYATGHDVPEDDVLAHMWSNLAASAASDAELRRKAVSSREMLERRMTPEQIAEAERRAREWTENHMQDDRGGAAAD